MALLLLGLVLSLASAQSSTLRRDFNMARVEGSWFLISLASNNMTRIGVTGDLQLYIRDIKFLDGNLKFSFRFMLQGQCEPVTVLCKKTQRNGEFSIAYEGENKVLVLETNYWMYVIFYLRNIQNGIETRVLALYGRIPTLSRPYLDRFKMAYSKYGMHPSNAIDMAQKGPCYF
uniref:Lipocalin/cytosolic fatty-acid binding domain-containing protein n=1 Tax=Cavia porcellus TaxID=10141 RepID=H0VW61_CAVPO